MTFNLEKYSEICQLLEDVKSIATIIAVTKTQPIENIKEALSFGIRHFGEIKVQEAIEKFITLKADNIGLKLHMIGALQTNKVKKALKIFDFFHSLDRDSLAKEFFKYRKYTIAKYFFVQVNTGQEKQKSGIQQSLTSEFIHYCVHDLNLKVVGLMCLPPANEDPREHFTMLGELALKNNLKQLSMGMSGDYKIAIQCGATFIRIGSSFFGERQ